MTTSLRTDKKCGNSNIPDDKQCKAGGGIGRKIATGAAIAGGAALAAYGANRLSKSRSFGSNLNRTVRQKALPGTADPNYKRPGPSPFSGAASSASRTARAASVMGRRAANRAGSQVRSTVSNIIEGPRSGSFTRAGSLGNMARAASYQTSRRTAFGRGLRRAGREASYAGRQAASAVGGMFGRRDSVWAAGFDPTDF